MTAAAAHPWKPSDGFIWAGPEPVDTDEADDEGGIDLDLAIALAELDDELDIAAALAAWTPDDWAERRGRPPAGSFKPDDVDTDLASAMAMGEIGAEADICGAACGAFDQADWFGVLRGARDRLHSFLFDHATLVAATRPPAGEVGRPMDR